MSSGLGGGADGHHRGPGPLRRPCRRLEADLRPLAAVSRARRREWGGHEQPVRVGRGAHRGEPAPVAAGTPRRSSTWLVDHRQVQRPGPPRLHGVQHPVGVLAHAPASRRRSSVPTPSTRNAPSIRSSAPPRGDGRDSAPPSWRTSANSSCDPEPGPGGRDQRLDGVRAARRAGCCWRGRRSAPPGRGAAGPGTRPGRTSKVSISGRSARSGARSRAAARGPRRSRRRRRRGGGRARRPAATARRGPGTAAATLVPRPGASAAHCGPGVEHPLRRAPSPRPACRRTASATGQQVELQRGDHAEAAPAAARRPQQVAVLLVGGAHEGAVGEHDLDRGQRAALQAVRRPYQFSPPPREEPTTPTLGLDMCRPASRAAPARVDDVAPQHAGADPGGPPRRVDAQLGHRRGAQQHGVAEPAGQRGRAVTGALRARPGGPPRRPRGPRRRPRRGTPGRRRQRAGRRPAGSTGTRASS